MSASLKDECCGHAVCPVGDAAVRTPGGCFTELGDDVCVEDEHQSKSADVAVSVSVEAGA
jgi:hypothetical protein